MRRRDREVTDPAEIAAVLDRCRVCRLALNTGDAPYIVPLNFGYALDADGLTLYFHGAAEGRKIDLLRRDPRVGFELDTDHELVVDADACRHSFRYASVIGAGVASFARDREEKTRGLARLMRHLTGADHAFLDAALDGVCVFEVRATTFSAKRHAPPGRAPEGHASRP